MASETEEQGEARMRANQSERLAAETDEQRKARLQRVRANQSGRLAAETEEQREARLQRMRTNQSERLAAETEQQREARLQRDRGTTTATAPIASITTTASVAQLLFYSVFIITIYVLSWYKSAILNLPPIWTIQYLYIHVYIKATSTPNIHTPMPTVININKLNGSAWDYMCNGHIIPDIIR